MKLGTNKKWNPNKAWEVELDVFYNGRTKSESSCQSAKDLVPGVPYVAVRAEEYDGGVNYILKGFEEPKNPEATPGYNSNWFKIVPVEFARLCKKPVVGECLEGLLVQNKRGEWESFDGAPKALRVTALSESVYKVYVNYTTYIVQVVCK